MVMLLTCPDCIPSEIGPVSIQQTDVEQGDNVTVAIATTSFSTPSIETPDAITQAEFARTPQTPPSVPATQPNRAWIQSAAAPVQPLLQLGSRGEAVQSLQTQLQQQGYYTDATDGIFGRRTQAAVRAWQRSHNLPDDGMVGAETWATLTSPSDPSSASFTTQSPEAPAQPPAETSESSPEATPQPQAAKPSQLTEAPEVLQEATPQPQDRPRAPITYDFDTDSPSYALWIVGWAVIYGAGWVIIIRDGMRQHQARRTKRAIPVESPPTYHSSPNPPETAPNTEPSNPPTPRSEPVAAIAAPTKPPAPPPQSHPAPLPEPIAIASPPPPAAPEMPLVEAIGEEVPIALANAGRLTSEDYLFPYLEDHDSDIVDLSDEQVVARLPATATDLEEEVFHYSLVDRAEGLFVLRGNELRVLKSRLERYGKGQPIHKTITIRRTSNRGEFIDKSFNLTIGKTA
ncbi:MULTISPECIES: peptidoglycan-binding protein [unclassified Leptolyngbya]|uniref:peptidoglycan-binding protein n=1 Tax=unclassified Leptolyngbya TaxID=2650499 RepID=UPI00168A0B53|nr:MULTISPECIES: peptidoglycan-binding protein [unclassified Leptolyngbya]MBD1913977.1 peptidoglycan-binding protein [Leptolyngbya sp. FACHB-8]MBD2155944.1 peptidoglycan-binding protein [Leptolyngbya sp. FACHB-16]